MKKNLPALLLLTSISTLTGFTQADVAKVNAEAMQGQTPKTSVYTPDNSEIEYLVLNDTAIIMGDIAVGSQQEIQSKGISTLEVKDFDQLNTLSDELTAKAAWAGATTWPNSVVPFVIDASSQPDAAVIRAGMDLIASQTGVRFVQRNNQTNYLRIFKGQGCWSFIGRKGGQQNLSIGPGCAWKKTVAHELMHALGFLHEQSRADRDNFVRINYNNIQDGRAGQFNKKGPITTSVGSYDYHSVMHYGHKAFSKNGKSTIVSLDPNIPNQQLGKSNGLTNKDIAAIRNKYGSGNASPLTAFENCDFTGWSAKIPEGHHNLKFLKTKGFVNDQMSSFKVAPGWGIRVYKDVGWSGDYTKIMTGNKACMGSFNDEVSSLRVVPAGSTALANKTFYIKNGDSGLFMDTLNVEHPTANALSQTTFAGGTNQQFTFIHHGNGVYSIASPSAKTVVSATHEDTIVQRSASRQTSSSDGIHGGQKFIALKQGRHYQFISLETQKVLVGKHGTLKQTTNHNQATSYWELLDI